MQFDFGSNWLVFSQQALDPQKAGEAVEDFKGLLGDIPIQGKTFLDIGFGQGLSILAARHLGAKVVGNDINPRCLEALNATQEFFPQTGPMDFPVIIGSILDGGVVDQIRGQSPQGFDIVHSWGVLHHTGRMYDGLKTAASLVGKNGHLIIAIYNRHWSSKGWLWVKKLYNRMPSMFKKPYVLFFYGVIFLAKILTVRKNPLNKERGMSFFYDVVDWVGGYPYEYASTGEIDAFLHPLGFERKALHEPETPIGCNELVYQLIN